MEKKERKKKAYEGLVKRVTRRYYTDRSKERQKGPEGIRFEDSKKRG